MMNTFQLQCFLAVANSLSFARAAEQMSVSQPAVTHQIQTLESELSAKLFYRSTRVVELTQDGIAFLSYARKIVEIEQQAKLRFGDPEGRPFETLSIGTGSHTLFTDLGPVLAELLAARPNLHPKLYVATHERLFHMLDHHSVHIMFNFREIAPKREHLAFAPLCRSSLVGVGRPAPSEEREGALSAGQLARRAVIIHDPVFLSSEALGPRMDLPGNRSRGNIHFSDSVAGAIALAKAGYGLAVIPEVYARNCEALEIYRLEQAPKLTFGLFYNDLDRGEPLASFLKLTKKLFSHTDGS